MPVLCQAFLYHEVTFAGSKCLAQAHRQADETRRCGLALASEHVWIPISWCVQAAQLKGALLPPAHTPQNQETPSTPPTTQAKSPGPGTYQNLILQRGNHSNHEKHRERGERVTEAEWEACGWQLTGSLAQWAWARSPWRGALRAWRPSGTLHSSACSWGPLTWFPEAFFLLIWLLLC